MRTFASIFTGGGGTEIGAIAAGLTPIWGVEYNPAIAHAYQQNFGEHVHIARAEDVDYAALQSPFWLHMSPVCKNASIAKTGGEESAEDLAMAQACVRAVQGCFATHISLENVWGYRNFESFRLILNALANNGYSYKFWHLNSADYGVPQTRKRLILLASKIKTPQRPTATHREGGDLFLPAWVGWYEAIADIIHTLPSSQFAEWQIKRLPKYRSTFLLMTGNTSDEQANFGVGVRLPIEPANGVYASPNTPRAFLVDDQNNGTPDAQKERGLTIRTNSQPSHTISATQNKRAVRAFIAHPTADNPRFVVRTDDEPMWTQKTNGLPRAWLEQGRVVAMTPRALARFQSMPDSYILPEKAGLACEIIGNCVPPLLAQRFIESLL